LIAFIKPSGFETSEGLLIVDKGLQIRDIGDTEL
jgi:hypothetical protein